MNPVLLLTHNGLELTKRCVESLLAQNISTTPCVVDNGSKDGTVAWADSKHVLLDASPFNLGVSIGWNHGLKYLFDKGHDHVIVVGNDTWLPPWFCRTILTIQFPFVTGVAVDNMEQAMQPPCIFPITENPDFSAFMIRRECWEKVGKFDERMKLYASDTDYHVRAHRLGVPLVKASIPYYHERSSTMKLAPEKERQLIQEQANKDRETFKSLYNCVPGTKEYEAIFS